MIFSLNTKEWDINKEGVTMFEKEAEKITNKILCSEKLCFTHCNFSSPKHHRCGEWHRCYESAKDGAEFGYNKSNEWHYPLKGEYPKEYKDLWICFVTEDDMKDYVRGWYEYDFDEDKHIFKTVNEITLILENVYAWKELIPPKEVAE